jgi:protein-tyrosine phosphatase
VKRAGARSGVLYGEGMERVELHFHLLPGVDDGPPDLATALELAREARRDGTRLVTCTPHAAFVDVAEIPARVRQLQGALREAGIDLEVRAGAELAWDDVPGLDGAELETVAQGPPGRRWLLLEAPLPGTGTLDGLQASARELRDRGFGLLIGHPERSPALTAPGAVERLLAAGDRLQVNASSLTGYHGPAARAAALELVGAGRASVIASDAHRPDERRPSLSPAVAVLRRHGTPAAQAEQLVSDAPRALLEHGLSPRRRLAA